MLSVIIVTVCQDIMTLSSPLEVTIRIENRFREGSVPGKRNENIQGGIFHA
jgi:hypothetical protein